MSAPAGFLVVRSVDPDRAGDKGFRHSRYSGVDRVPPYPADDENEQHSVEDYVFGDYKDEATNLIPSFDSALRLHCALSSGGHKYEIVFCCEDSDSDAVHRIERNGLKIEHLGYDVANLRGDYWSIVGDFSRSAWASHFRGGINEFGLFRRRADAEAYLKEYRDRGEPDSDSSFDVVYVVRVLGRRETTL